MNGHTAGPPPLSPNGSEWSGFSHYNNSGPPARSPGFGHHHNRSNLITPPISGSSNGTQVRMSNGMSGPRPDGPRPGGPSPPNSIGARSSYGTTMSSSDTRRRQTIPAEERLSQHYAILKRFLGQSLRDEKGNMKPNKARDKLLRLSGVQFQELSTDVYDELLRRQSAQGQQMNGPGQVPQYLLPRDNFHPKRNQARQKLATLPPPRFRDLATDVFYELERRYPNFAGRDIPRNGSPALGPPSRVGTPNGMRASGYAARNQSLSGQGPGAMGGPGGPEDPYGRPTAKQFQSNTIIPNKSTMVEDDDDDGLSDVYASRRDTTLTTRSAGVSEKDRKAIADFEAQVNELQNRIKSLGEKIQEKDSVIEDLNEQQLNASSEREKFSDLQSNLETRLQSANELNTNMQSEIDRMRSEQATSERELRSQIDAMTSQAQGGSEWKSRYEALDQSHQETRADLSRQEEITTQVRQEAKGLLTQMKALSERGMDSIEREQHLVSQVHKLESEVQEWKDRYTRAKTQARSTHASSKILSVHPVDAGSMANSVAFTSQDGTIEDTHVTRFQIAVDELLSSARASEPQSVLPNVKSVIIAVRNITLDLDRTQAKAEGDNEQRQKIKGKISATANNLITAARNFAGARGLSPVSLLDAAASHLSSSIVEAIRIVKMRPSPVDGLDEDGNSDIVDSPAADYYGFSNGRSSGDSTYSIESKPQLSSRTFSGDGRKPAPNGISNGVSQVQGPTSHPSNMNGNVEELKNFLDSRTDTLRATLQALISSIRTSAPPHDVLDSLASMTSTASQIIHQTARSVPDGSKAMDIADTLAQLVERMEDQGREGEQVNSESVWKEYVKELPPIGFEMAREVKELASWVEGEVNGRDSS